MPRAGTFETALETHARGNRQGKDNWALYAGHRARLMAAIAEADAEAATDAATEAEPARGRGAPRVIGLLGAGNCNDVDLEALAARFAEIHLADLDAAALDRARARQRPQVRERIVLHAPVDLSGLLRALDAFRAGHPTLGAIDEAAAAGLAAITRALPPARCDVVVSGCVLTQLSWGLSLGLGEGHPALADVRAATVALHLRTLLALARPGGVALVAADLLSSELHPPLADLPPGTDLAALEGELVARGAYYAGSNPLLLQRTLRRDPALRAGWGPPRALAPWLWTGPFDRTYLVYARLLRRRTDAPRPAPP